MISILKTKKEIRDVKELISQMQCEDISGLSKGAFLEKDEAFIRESAEQIVQSMSPSERSKFVNENIVLTTIEFQNRIQHIFKLLKIKGFIDSSNKYRLDDSFIRIEHQVRAYNFNNKPICYSVHPGVLTNLLWLDVKGGGGTCPLITPPLAPSNIWLNKGGIFQSFF